MHPEINANSVYVQPWNYAIWMQVLSNPMQVVDCSPTIVILLICGNLNAANCCAALTLGLDDTPFPNALLFNPEVNVTSVYAFP